jgi:hypothetical protein
MAVPGFAGREGVEFGDAEERGTLDDDLVAGAEVLFTVRGEADAVSLRLGFALDQFVPAVPQAVDASFVLGGDDGFLGEQGFHWRGMGLDVQGGDGFRRELEAVLLVGGRHGVSGTDAGGGFFFTFLVAFFPVSPMSLAFLMALVIFVVVRVVAVVVLVAVLLMGLGDFPA